MTQLASRDESEEAEHKWQHGGLWHRFFPLPFRGQTQAADPANETLCGQTRRRAVTRQENCVNLTSCFLQKWLQGKREGPLAPKDGISFAKARAPREQQEG